MAGEILCVERAWCERVLSGGSPLPSRFLRPATPHEVLTRLVGNGHALWISRGDAESDPHLKQLIPYALVMAPGGDKILSYRRSKAGGESRLHCRWSIGFGGHVEREDMEGLRVATPTFAVRRCCYRELREELGWPRESPYLSLAGFVNTEEDEVGAVHLGVVFTALAFNRLEEFSPSPDIADLDYRDYNGIVHGECESWTRLILESGILA